MHRLPRTANIITFSEMSCLFFSESPSRCSGFRGGSDSKELACSAGDLGLIPRSGRFPGEGNGFSLQYSCLENFMDRGVWWATVHGVTKSWTRQ